MSSANATSRHEYLVLQQQHFFEAFYAAKQFTDILALIPIEPRVVYAAALPYTLAAIKFVNAVTDGMKAEIRKATII